MSTMENELATISLKDGSARAFKLPLPLSALESDDELLAASYAIGVINLSSKCLTIAGTRRIGAGDAEWKWTPIPKTCKNCSTTYQQCFSEKRWSIVMTTNCDSAPFELFLGYPVDDTNVQGAVWDIQPTCSVAGGVIGLTD